MTNRVDKVIERAQNYAVDSNHEYVTIEHFLLSLLNEKDILTILINIKFSIIFLTNSEF